jgi:hypothetical protein
MSHENLQIRTVKVKMWVACYLTFKTTFYGNSLKLDFKTDEILIT